MFTGLINLTAQRPLRYAAALFVFSLTVNLAQFNWAEAPIIYPDSHGYIRPAWRLSQGRLPDFSVRSPTYPMYLLTTGFFARVIQLPPLKLAAWGQMVLGAVTIVFLYLVCLKLLNSARWASGVAALLSLNFHVNNYQSAILTETLATTLLMAVLYAHIASMTGALTLKRVLGLLILDALLVTVRPNFAAFPAVLYTLQLVYSLAVTRTAPRPLHSEAPRIAFFLLGISSNVALVAAWGAVYYLQTGRVGLSDTSEFNLLGKAIQYGYLDQHDPNPPSLIRRAREIYRQVERPHDPYSIIRQLRREGLYSFENLRSINAHLLAGRGADYAVKTAQLMPVVLDQQADFYYGGPKAPLEKPRLVAISQKVSLLNTLNSKAVLIASGLALYVLLAKRREQFIALILTLSAIFYHVMTISALGYSEYLRLRAPIDLLLNTLVLLPLLLFAVHVSERIKLRPVNSVARADSIR
jgi:hypothetical protein